jgi:hypothetical protein
LASSTSSALRPFKRQATGEELEVRQAIGGDLEMEMRQATGCDLEVRRGAVRTWGNQPRRDGAEDSATVLRAPGGGIPSSPAVFTVASWIPSRYAPWVVSSRSSLQDCPCTTCPARQR